MESQAQAHEMVRRMVDQAQERARQAHAMVDELESLRVVGQSRSGTRVVLGHTGALVEVTLGDRLGNADLTQIEGSIREANADAQFKLKRQITALADAHYGENSETTKHFSQQYDQLFPHAEESDGGTDPNGGLLR